MFIRERGKVGSDSLFGTAVVKNSITFEQKQEEISLPPVVAQTYSEGAFRLPQAAQQAASFGGIFAGSIQTSSLSPLPNLPLLPDAHQLPTHLLSESSSLSSSPASIFQAPVYGKTPEPAAPQAPASMESQADRDGDAQMVNSSDLVRFNFTPPSAPIPAQELSVQPSPGLKLKISKRPASEAKPKRVRAPQQVEWLSEAAFKNYCELAKTAAEKSLQKSARFLQELEHQVFQGKLGLVTKYNFGVSWTLHAETVEEVSIKVEKQLRPGSKIATLSFGIFNKPTHFLVLDIHHNKIVEKSCNAQLLSAAHIQEIRAFFESTIGLKIVAGRRGSISAAEEKVQVKRKRKRSDSVVAPVAEQSIVQTKSVEAVMPLEAKSSEVNSSELRPSELGSLEFKIVNLPLERFKRGQSDEATLKEMGFVTPMCSAPGTYVYKEKVNINWMDSKGKQSFPLVASLSCTDKYPQGSKFSWFGSSFPRLFKDKLPGQVCTAPFQTFNFYQKPFITEGDEVLTIARTGDGCAELKTVHKGKTQSDVEKKEEPEIANIPMRVIQGIVYSQSLYQRYFQGDDVSLIQGEFKTQYEGQRKQSREQHVADLTKIQNMPLGQFYATFKYYCDKADQENTNLLNELIVIPECKQVIREKSIKAETLFEQPELEEVLKLLSSATKPKRIKTNMYAKFEGAKQRAIVSKFSGWLNEIYQSYLKSLQKSGAPLESSAVTIKELVSWVYEQSKKQLTSKDDQSVISGGEVARLARHVFGMFPPKKAIFIDASKVEVRKDSDLYRIWQMISYGFYGEGLVHDFYLPQGVLANSFMEASRRVHRDCHWELRLKQEAAAPVSVSSSSMSHGHGSGC